MALQGSAFAQAATLSGEAIAIAVTIVFLAGLSEGIAQSIVLFANRVKPARLIFSWAVNALLFLFGYAFLVLSTWAVCRLPHAPKLSLAELAIALALTYAPLLFSFFGALPYLGPGILTGLRIWHLLAMVVGVAAIGNVPFLGAAAYVLIGWTVMMLAQRSFGKPLVALGKRLLHAVAGVQFVDDERLMIGRAVSSATDAQALPGPSGAAQSDGPASNAPRRKAWQNVLALGGVALLALVVATALDPVRAALFGWEVHLPRSLGFVANLLWLGIVAFVVSALMAPLETLGWWAGWYGDRIDTTTDAVVADDRAPANRTARYAIYLDGISQSSSQYMPDIETFLDALAPELPAGVRLIRGLMVYSVMNRPLDEDPLWSRLWKFVDWQRPGGTGRKENTFARNMLGMIINLRNVIIVAVSADPRYGPMYNFGIAYVMYRSLLANGYRRNAGIPVTLIGYSGGAQMACGSARFLKEALGAPVEVISLGGVMSGNDPILDLERLYHLVGDKDFIERTGSVMFPSRWKIAVRSYWNIARRLGRLVVISLGPVGHQVPGGMLDPNLEVADGRSSLRQTLDYIVPVLAAKAIEPALTR